MSTGWVYDALVPGWTRFTGYPVPGTRCVFELVEVRHDDGDQAAGIELAGELPADPDTLRAAALVLLGIADNLGQ